MSEYTIGYLTIAALVGVLIGATLYMIGGRANKWIRRYLGSLVIAADANIMAAILGVWDKLFLLNYPALIVIFSLGYGGGDPRWMNIIKRIVIALASVAAGLLFVLKFNNHHAWTLFICQAIAASMSVILGIKNPVPAATEEPLVCVSLTMFLPIYPFTAIL